MLRRKKVRFMTSVSSVGALPSKAIETAAADTQEEQEDYLLDISNVKVLKCGVHSGVDQGKHAVAYIKQRLLYMLDLLTLLLSHLLW